MEIYENQIVASLEKTTGRNLLGEELSALSFFIALQKDDFDAKQKVQGYLNFE